MENNFRVYSVKASKCTQIASHDIELDPTKWQEISIEMIGAKITAYMNGEKLLDIDDTTFSEAGHIGLWTKADAATAFDDLRVEEVK